MAPVMYSLAKDYQRFGLTKEQADVVLSHRIYQRRGHQPTHLIYHIQDGKTWGSLIHWVGVSASSTYMVQRDGSILLVIPEEHGPWTNGDVCSPDKEAVKDESPDFWNDPNVYSITIEAEGTPWEPLTQVQLDSIEWLSRDIYRRYPKITFRQTNRHRHINACDRWNCPGASDNNDYFLAMEKRIVQSQPTTVYADPILFDFLEKPALDEGIDRRVTSGSGKVTILYACRRRWTVKNDTPRRRQASLSTRASNLVGPPLLKGQTFPGEFVFHTSAGWWVLTEYGTRVFMGDLVEQVRVL